MTRQLLNPCQYPIPVDIPSGGGSALRFTVLTTAVNNTPVDYGQIMEADATGGAIDINLPQASGVTATGPNILVVKNSGTANAVGLTLHAGNGVDSGIVSLQVGQYIMLVSDGVSRFIDVADNVIGGGPVLTGVRIANYVADLGEYVQCDSTGGNFNVTLPAALGSGGMMVTVKNKTNNAGAVTVLPAGANTIDGGASAVVAGLEVLKFVSDGVSDWMVS